MHDIAVDKTFIHTLDVMAILETQSRLSATQLDP